MEGAFFDSLEAHAPCVLVVGDVMIDHYVWGECERISPEAPVAVVDVKSESRRLGGACNVMHNLLALGASVIPCGVVGDDSVGAEIRNKLSEMGIDTAGLVSQDNRLSTQKTRIIASNQQVVRVDWEQRHDISAQSEERILAFVRQAIEHVDCVVLSDYAKGVLTSSLTPQIIALANAANKRVLVDPKGSDYRKYRGATLLTPNKKEAQSATGIALARGDDSHLKQALLALREQCALAYPLITLSEEGIGILHNDELLRVPTIAREVYDVTGAGDTVIAALAFVLCCGESIVRAVQFANAAAAVVVGKIGSATASLAEIRHYAHASKTQSKRVFTENLASLVANLRACGKTIVWTNGCFDILHYGHVAYLQEARDCGDVLIVGVNSDDSVRALKGQSRPINTLEDRIGVLCALSAVDFVISFEEQTPLALIKAIKPDVLVKGSDYAGKEIVGAEFAGEVQLAKLLSGRSSSAVIAKIRAQS